MPRASGNAHAAQTAAPAAPRKRGRPPVQRSDTPTPEEQLLELRRLNLHVLTAQPGSKGKLGEILGMSPANISHRLHGLKKLDDEQVMLITTALEMDPKWFDSPRKEKDVPASVHKLLDPGPKLPRGAKKAAREAARAAKTAGQAPAKRAARKTPTRVLAPADLNMPRLSAGVVSAAPAAAQTPAPSPALALVGGGAAAAPAPAAARPARAPTAAPTAAPVARTPAPAPAGAVGPTTPALNEEDLSGISSLGVALIKMLAVKARQGRLDDARAIALLTEVAQL